MTGPQVGIVTDDGRTARRASGTSTPSGCARALDEGNIVIVAGLPGLDDRRRDHDARAAAARTRRPWRWPRRSRPTAARSTPTSTASTPPIRASCKSARKLDVITYDEMLELASLGAKVLHSRSVELAKNFNVPLQVLSSFTQAPGTMVVKEYDEHGRHRRQRRGLQPQRGQDFDPGRARPARHGRAAVQRAGPGATSSST